MINLLPPDVKESITFARRNTRLRKWSISLLVSVLAIGGIVIAGHLYMQQSIRTLSAQVEQGNQQLEAQKLTETQNQVKELTNSLKLVVQVLSREILFSKLLSQVGSALPSGAVLTQLSINTIQGGLDLQASAVDYQTATQVQVNLQDPQNKIFEKADIVNVQCTNDPSSAGAQSGYPCTVQLRALFAKNNPFLFITKGTTP
jgi:Tfp pilus assembly protein PilN